LPGLSDDVHLLFQQLGADFGVGLGCDYRSIELCFFSIVL
jgi:hypothetical protein